MPNIKVTIQVKGYLVQSSPTIHERVLILRLPLQGRWRRARGCTSGLTRMSQGFHRGHSAAPEGSHTGSPSSPARRRHDQDRNTDGASLVSKENTSYIIHIYTYSAVIKNLGNFVPTNLKFIYLINYVTLQCSPHLGVYNDVSFVSWYVHVIRQFWVQRGLLPFAGALP